MYPLSVTETNAVQALQTSFESARNSYRAAQQTRFSKPLTGTNPSGANADYHYQYESDYFRLVELARERDRNDIIVGQAADRFIANLVQDGFGLDVKTRSPEINSYVKEKWHADTSNPYAIDHSRERSFAEMERLILRHVLIDGDHVVLPTLTGRVQCAESHRLRSPYLAGVRAQRNTVHGVELNSSRERVAYWLTEEDLDPTETIQLSDATRYPARDQAGNKMVWHIMHPKRVSQTRGVTKLAAIMDTTGMHDDIQFARLVQQQVVSVWTMARERPLQWADQAGDADDGWGSEADPCNPGEMRPIRNVAPGMIYTGHPGEQIKMLSPNVPNPTFFDHARQIQMLIGINFGLPLAMLLLDSSETNFSGWRGALDQAKIQFRQVQSWYASVLHREMYLWKMRLWSNPASPFADPVLVRARQQGMNVFNHEWVFPTWPYVQPLQDISADLLEGRNAINSWRRIQRKHSRDWDVVSSEIVEDNAIAIVKAKEKAKEINAMFPEDEDRVRWRELISLPTPDGVQINLSPDTAQQGQENGSRDQEQGQRQS